MDYLSRVLSAIGQYKPDAQARDHPENRHFSLIARKVWIKIQIVLVLNGMVLVLVLGYPRSSDIEHEHRRWLSTSTKMPSIHV